MLLLLLSRGVIDESLRLPARLLVRVTGTGPSAAVVGRPRGVLTARELRATVRRR